MSPQHAIFENRTKALTDRVNNLSGRDSKYLYVYDRQAGSFAIREEDEEVFVYGSK